MKLFQPLVILLLYFDFIRGDDFDLGLNIYRSTVVGISRDSKTAKVLLPILFGFKTAGVLIIALIITAAFTIKSVIAAKLAFSVTLALVMKKILDALSRRKNNLNKSMFFKSKFSHDLLPTKYYFMNEQDKINEHQQVLINDHFVESENRNEKYRVIESTESSTLTSSTTVSHRRRSDYLSLRNRKRHG